MHGYAVVAEGLTREFEGKRAVDHLDLRVEAGEFFGFLGPNGAGKSTTIKMLVGLLRPTTGRAEIDGIDVWREPLAAKARLGVLPEDPPLYERLTGREFIQFAGAMYGLPEAEVRRRTGDLLDLLALGRDGDRLIADYSRGMRKKTALAAALIHNPRVLFLDEPFEGVDTVSSHAIRTVLRELARAGTTIFFSSHIMELVERLCTRLAIIKDGRIVAEGTPQQLYADTDTGTLEEVFLRVVGAPVERPPLDWLTAG